MNATRRKAIDAAIALVVAAEAAVNIIKEAMEEIKEGEEEYLDNMPESLQSGEKGAMAQEAIDNLDEAFSALHDVDFDDIREYLEAAKS